MVAAETHSAGGEGRVLRRLPLCPRAGLATRMELTEDIAVSKLMIEGHVFA